MSDTHSIAPILLLDSGIGGLSIAESILAAGLRCPLVYVADNAWFPYGLRDEADLQARVVALMQVLVEQYHPQLVVLACNTLSTLALPALRAQFHVPFVGVVPAIKPAAQMSRNKSIALLATPATVRRPYIDDLIAQYAADCQVLRVGSSALVEEAENLLHGRALNHERIAQTLEPIRRKQANGLDTVVLGCTHFPLLRAELDRLAPGLHWVDSGEAIARRVRSLLAEPVIGASVPELELVFTAPNPALEALAQALNLRALHCRRFSVLERAGALSS